MRRAVVDDTRTGPFPLSMDTVEIARAYRRRADARERDRLERFQSLRERAQAIATELRAAFGTDVRVYAIGSLLDVDRFHAGSDIDLVVEGLDPEQYWRAGRIAEEAGGGTRVDLLRLETASRGLRECVSATGLLLG
jgi:hypothetical protein